jgi:hypothetical protein
VPARDVETEALTGGRPGGDFPFNNIGPNGNTTMGITWESTPADRADSRAQRGQRQPRTPEFTASDGRSVTAWTPEPVFRSRSPRGGGGSNPPARTTPTSTFNVNSGSRVGGQTPICNHLQPKICGRRASRPNCNHRGIDRSGEDGPR